VKTIYNKYACYASVSPPSLDISLVNFCHYSMSPEGAKLLIEFPFPFEFI